MLGTAAAIVIAAVGARADERHRGRQWELLDAIGFSNSQVTRIRAAETTAIAAIATLVCTAASLAVTTLTGAPSTALFGILAAPIVAVVAGLPSRRTT